MPRYLKRRKRGWYFQLDIPANLRGHFGGKARIEQTLSTRDEKLAEAKANQLAGEYKLQFLALQGSGDAEKALARTTYQAQRDEVLGGEVVAYGTPDDDPAGFGVELAIDKIIDKPGRKVDEDGDPVLSEIEEATIAGLLDGLRELRGLKPKHRNRFEPPFKDVADDWLKSWESSRDRRPSNTGAQYGSAIRVFSDFWGEKTIREITEPDAAKFVELLKQLPPNYGRGRFKGLTLQQSIEAVEDGPKGLAPSTIKRHLIVLGQIWDWAKQHGRCAGDNPFRLKLPKVKKQGYLPWEMADLEKLFRTRPKRDDIVEVFTASLFTGMRLGELAELTWGSIREEEGVHFILVEDAKTEAGRRKVPVHTKLDWLLRKVRGAEDELVWPTFQPEGARKAGTGDASKLFGAWKRRAGFTSRRFTFHSARKNFVSQLEQSGVAQSEAARLVGHEVGFTYSTYSPKGLNLARLKELVELVRYPDCVTPKQCETAQ